MSYKKVTLEQDLVAIRDDVRKARKDGSYEDLAENFDGAVLDTIEEGIALAQANSRRHKSDVEAIHARCKAKLDEAETWLKRDTLDAKEYLAIKTNMDLVKKNAEDLHVLRKDFADAMARGFRGGWPAIAKEALSPATKYAEDNRRKEMIDLDNKASTMAARCNEYVARAAELRKQAVQREKGGAVEIAEFQKDIASHLAAMTEHKDFVEGRVTKVRGSVAWFEKKDLKAAQLDLLTSHLTVVERAAKEARGRLKTANMEHDGLEARAKKAGPGWKDMALKAVKDSDKVVKEVASLAAGLQKSEKDCAAVFAQLQKKFAKT